MDFIEKLPERNDTKTEAEIEAHRERQKRLAVRLVKDEVVAGQVERLAAVALTKTQVAIACRLSVDQLTKLYAEEYARGLAKAQDKIASKAMEAVEKGNPQMIMYMAKARLGWTENNVVEHVGEVRHTVSAKAMTREEFARKYLEEEVVEAAFEERDSSVTIDVSQAEEAQVSRGEGEGSEQTAKVALPEVSKVSDD